MRRKHSIEDGEYFIAITQAPCRGESGREVGKGYCLEFYSTLDLAQVAAAQALQTSRIRGLSLVQEGFATRDRSDPEFVLYHCSAKTANELGARSASDCWTGMLTSDSSGARKRRAAPLFGPERSRPLRSEDRSSGVDPLDGVSDVIDFAKDPVWSKRLAQFKGKFEEGELSTQSFSSDEETFHIGPLITKGKGKAPTYLVWMSRAKILQPTPASMLKVSLTLAGSKDAPLGRGPTHPWRVGHLFQIGSEDYEHLFSFLRGCLMVLTRDGVAYVEAPAGYLNGILLELGRPIPRVPQEPEQWTAAICKRAAFKLNSIIEEVMAKAEELGQDVDAQFSASSPRGLAAQLVAASALARTPKSTPRLSVEMESLQSSEVDPRRGSDPSSGHRPRTLGFSDATVIASVFDVITSSLRPADMPEFCERACDVLQLEMTHVANKRTVALVSSMINAKLSTSGGAAALAKPTSSSIDAAIAALAQAIGLNARMSKLSGSSEESHSTLGGGSSSTSLVVSAAKQGEVSEISAEQVAELQLLNKITTSNTARRALSRLEEAAQLKDFTTMRTVLREDDSAEVGRLMAMTSKIAGASIEGVKYAAHLQQLAMVRAALDAAAAPPLQDDAGHIRRERSPGYKAQAKYIRAGAWSKVRVAKLIGKRDKAESGALDFLDAPRHATSNDGLEGDENESEASTLFVAGMAAISRIYLQYYPDDVGSTEFWEALRALIAKHRAEGNLSWAQINLKLWAPLAARMEAQWARFIEGALGERPRLDAQRLLSDSAVEVRALTKASEKAAVQAAAIAAVQQRKPKPGTPLLRKPGVATPITKRQGAKSGKRAGRGGKQKMAEKEAEEAQSEDAEVDDAGDDEAERQPARRVEDKKLWINRAKGPLKDAAAVARKLGTKDKLCRFFFSEKGCWHADQCYFKHVGKSELAR